MAYLDDLKTARDNAASALATALADPRPSYSIDGQSVPYSDYVKMLRDSISDLNVLILTSEPYIYTSQVM